MKQILILALILGASMSFLTKANNHETGITGIVIDIQTSDPIPFANLILRASNGIVISAVQSGVDGRFKITGLSPGIFDLEVSYAGYRTKTVQGIELKSDKLKFVRVTMKAKETLEQVIVSKDVKLSADHIQYSSLKELSNISAPATMDYDGVYHNTESYSFFEDNQFLQVNKNALSTFSIDVDNASYSNIRRFINNGSLPPKDAVRIEEMINYFEYDYPQPEDSEAFSVSMDLTSAPWNEKHQLVHIGLKGYEIQQENLPSSNFVFLIDVSGSMNSYNKLGLVKQGLNLLVDQLRDSDRISIVVYAGAAGLVLPSTPGNKKEIIKTAINQLNAGGSTAGGAGIKLAYRTAKENFIKDGNNRVILATDGDFNVGISDEGSLVRLIEEKREDGIFLTVLGFGTGNYQDSRMEKLSNHGNGNYAYIDNLSEARKVLVTEAQGTLVTIAKDVKIQVEFNPEFVQAYRLIGYVNRKLENQDFNDDKKDAGELGAGHAVTALYEIVPVGVEMSTASVDSLKYQKNLQTEEKHDFKDEVLTVKLRYKAPQGDESKLVEKVLKNNLVEFSASSKNCQFASSVAAYGMLLRDSEHKGSANPDMIVSIANASIGADQYGYRREFISMVNASRPLFSNHMESMR